MIIAFLCGVCERLCWLCDRQMRGRWFFGPILRMLLRVECRLERRRESGLGIDTYGSTDICPSNSLGKDSVRYSPTNYYLLRPILDSPHLTADDVFVDLGCGKGRAVLMAAQRGCRKAVGVELSPELAEAARANAEALGLTGKVEIVETDAAAWDPTEGTVFFLFNPFGASTLQRLLDNLKSTLQTNPRRIRIAYLCHPHANLLDSSDWLEEDMTVRWRDVFRVWGNKLTNS